ncbi:MAG: cyclophilin-like fold protein [Gemmataceae bacterium]
MTRMIHIRTDQLTAIAESNDSATAQALWAALPIRARGNRWGEEIYFRVPADQGEADDARADLAVGEPGYWPPGQAFCIFFGRTPASTSDQPRAASPVNPIGRIVGDATLFRAVPDGAEVILEQA